MGALAGMAMMLGAWAAQAASAPEGPAPETAAALQADESELSGPVVEHVDPTAPVPLVAPSPQLAGLAYDSRLRASLIAAQSFQGPLDGGWRLQAADGALYDFQLVDRNNGVVEGAWRDLRRPGAPGASGFVDAIERQGSGVRLIFDGGRTAELAPGRGQVWTGALDGQAVVLARRGP